MKGFSGLPVDYQKAVKQMGDSLFLHTSYSFHSAVKRTMEYAQDIIIQNEGKVMEKEVMIVRQQPVAFPMEDAFQGVAFHKRLNMSDPGWKLSGSWMMDKDKSAIFSNKAWDELSLNFEGTGVSIEGWWIKEGGKADVYIDGVLKGTIDCFFYYANQEHRGINIFHILNLPQGKHSVRLVVKGEKRAESADCVIGVTGAVIFRASGEL